MQAIKVLEMILPVVTMIAIGALCGKKQVFGREGMAAIKKFAVNIALSAVVFNAFATAEYSLESIIIPIIMFVVCIGALYFGRLFIKLNPNNSPYLPYMLTGFEAGMLGYTLYGILYGSDISAFAVVDLGQVLFVFTFYKISLSKEFSKDKDINITREIFTSPIVLGIIAGILVGATGFYTQLTTWGLAGILDSVVGFIAAPTSALILLSIGFDLVSSKIHWGKSLKYTFLRLIAMLVLGSATLFIIRGLFGANQALDRAIILMFMMPPPFVLPIFADDPKEQSTIASMLSISTLVTLIGFVVLAVTGV